jgi:hypothetical protein
VPQNKKEKKKKQKKQNLTEYEGYISITRKMTLEHQCQPFANVTRDQIWMMRAPEEVTPAFSSQY